MRKIWLLFLGFMTITPLALAQTKGPHFWVSFFVHSETQDDVTAKLADALQKILSADAARAFASTIGGELMPLAPAAMREFQLNEIKRFRTIAEAAGIRAQ